MIFPKLSKNFFLSFQRTMWFAGEMVTDSEGHGKGIIRESTYFADNAQKCEKERAFDRRPCSMMEPNGYAASFTFSFRPLDRAGYVFGSGRGRSTGVDH